MDSNLNKKKQSNILVGKLLRKSKYNQKAQGFKFSGKDFAKNLEKEFYNSMYAIENGDVGIYLFEFVQYCKTIGFTKKQTYDLLEEAMVSIW